MQQRNSRRRPNAPLDMQAQIALAVQQLKAGNPLAAQRTVRAAEALMELSDRVQRRAALKAATDARYAQREEALRQLASDLSARDAALSVRERALAAEAQHLETLREDLDALYAKLYGAPASG